MLPWGRAALALATGLALLARSRADLNLAELKYSNVCGDGPDVYEARAIRYGDALQSRGDSIDLSIEAAENYQPGDSERNANFGEGQQLARISMKSNSRADLEFKFTKKGTNESRTISDVAFTFFLPGNGLTVSLFEFDHYCLAESTALVYQISSHPRRVMFLPKQPQDDAVAPKDPYSLTKEESSLAVTFYFKNVSSFKVHAHASDDHAAENQGTDIVFAGIAGTNPTKNCFSWGKSPAASGTRSSSSASEADASATSASGSTKTREKLTPFECESSRQFVEIAPHDESEKAGALTCVGRGLRPIATQAGCEEAARSMGMEDATVDISTDENRPEGCYSLHSEAGTTLWLSKNEANNGNGAETSDVVAGLLRQPICKQLAPEQWPETKASWCCENNDLGCKVASPKAAHSTAATTDSETSSSQRPNNKPVALAAERYNCTAAHTEDVKRWSDEHLYWCCSRHSVWCDTSTSTRESLVGTDTDATKKVTSTGTSTTTMASTTTRTTTKAPTTTSTTKATSTTTHTTTDKAKQGTDDGEKNPDCNGDPESWDDARKTWCCQQQARGCPSYVRPVVTAKATSKAATLTNAAATTTTFPPYDCLAGRANWRLGWSKGKQNWCCKRGLINCKKKRNDKVSPPDGIPKTVDFDCGAGLLNWDSLWSVAKQEWCCRMERLGCPKPSTTAPDTKQEKPKAKEYDCQAAARNWQHGWSEGKKTWCCQTVKVGCPDATTPDPYDCTAGFANWQLGWSRDKKKWCCNQYSRGCEADSKTTSDPFDCNAGASNWQLGWSTWKKDWCCKHYSLGCVAKKGTTTKPFNCQEDLQYWRTEWSAWKRDWCCRNEDLGCDRVLGPLEAKAEELSDGARITTQVKHQIPRLWLSRSPVFLLALALALTAGVLGALSTRIRPLHPVDTVRGMAQGAWYSLVRPEFDQNIGHVLIRTN